MLKNDSIFGIVSIYWKNARLFVWRFFFLMRLFLGLYFSKDIKPETKFRMFFEKAGGAFIKLGQILAMRYDILPAAYTAELVKLLSKVDTVPYEEIRKVFIAEHGSSPEEVFRVFDKEPVASASISQVYRAVTKDGQEVAVKIARPGIDRVFETDFALASLIGGIVGVFQIFKAVNINDAVEEFITWTKRELDFSYEAENSRILAEHSFRHPNTVIPKVFDQLSTKKVLVAEYMKDVFQVDELLDKRDKNPNFESDLLVNHRIDLRNMSYYFLVDGMRQYFIDGFFHADPHPGNIFILSDNRLGYFDFGIMGQAGENRLKLLKVIHGLVEGDLARVSRSFIEFSKDSFQDDLEVFRKFRKLDYRRYEKVVAKIEELILEEFEHDLEDVFSPWYDRREHDKNPSSSEVFAKLVKRVEKYSVYLPKEMIIFFRTLAIADMVCLRLNPDFDMLKGFKLFFQEFPLSKAEEIILSGDHEKELSGRIIPITDEDYETAAERRIQEAERLSVATERLIEMASYYAERYPEVRQLM